MMVTEESPKRRKKHGYIKMHIPGTILGFYFWLLP